ncbi:MAG: glycosyltransferase family 39 protein [Candidatus Solibacter usitatus]|nr:glycosyltransferase family 39 protein [Candidatus Solibacter usitatus]
MSPVSRAAAFCIFLLLTSIGVARIVLTYRVVSQTVDETPNIACGMEWLDRGTYNLGPFHPPLARIAMAAGPYLAGLRSQGNPDRWKEGNAILHSRGRYAKNLTLARLGILPFFILASTCVWLWGRSLMGGSGALAAVFLFTNTPMVLAHSGIATTDMAVTAGVVFALYHFTRWLEQPDPRRSVWLGVAFALAILAKFSSFLIVPLCALCILAAWCIAGRRFPPIRLRMWALAGVVAFLIVWAGYRFSVGRMQETPESNPAAASPFWRALSSVPLPAPQIPDGLLQVKLLNRDGHAAFLLGQVSNTGWWYFFPVALGVKTPLAVLLLALAGLFAVARGPQRWELWAPALCVAAILLACLPSHLNTGLRYILCLFPMLSLLAAQGIVFLWHSRVPRAAAAVLLVWLTASSLRAHPDYIPYFNELAGAHPENVVVDSDLDWGQDMRRLVSKLEELGVTRVHLAVLWSGDDSRIGLPGWEGLDPYQPVKGWVAISYFNLKTRGLLAAKAMGRAESGYAWLDRYQPVARVGKSILLYHIPE